MTPVLVSLLTFVAVACGALIGLQGTVKLARGGDLWHGFGHEHAIQSLPGLPPSRRDHQSGGLVVSRLSPGLRKVEIIFAARGVMISYETIPEWGLRSDAPMPKPQTLSADVR
jgi:hypothetical protein